MGLTLAHRANKTAMKCRSGGSRMFASGAQIRAARALLGWSQRDLARAAAVHVNAVRHWEQEPWWSVRVVESTRPGARRITSALRAARVKLTFKPFGVSVDPARCGKLERLILRGPKLAQRQRYTALLYAPKLIRARSAKASPAAKPLPFTCLCRGTSCLGNRGFFGRGGHQRPRERTMQQDALCWG